VAIATQDPWNSSPLEHPREPRETVNAGQRRKCHIIELAECSSIPEAGQRRKCNRIDLSECCIVSPLGSTSSSRNRWPGLRPRLEETVFQAEDSDRTLYPGGGPGRVLKNKRRKPNPPTPFPKKEGGVGGRFDSPLPPSRGVLSAGPQEQAAYGRKDPGFEPRSGGRS